jgi:tRNA G18 (ribose-2'-O)-methylase SpoU
VNIRPATDDDLELFSSLRGRRLPEGTFIGDGDKVVRRMLAATPVERILCTPEWADRIENADGVDVAVAPLDSLVDIVGFRLHQGVMALGRIPVPRPISGDFHLALDGLVDAENVGAILRTCAGFGVDGVLIGPGTASPWLRRSVRVSMGAALVVPIHTVPDLAGTLRGMNAWAAHIHGERRTYSDVDYRKPCCIVLGSEPSGVSAAVLEACKGVIYIPMAPDWDCLNVGASAAVLLAEVARQRGKVTP